MNDNAHGLPSNTVEQATKWLARQLESPEVGADPTLLDLAKKAHAAHEHYLTANLTNMKQMWPNMHKSNETMRELVAYIASKPTPKDY